jgi:tetratricopeptide (TPR) repeat protein
LAELRTTPVECRAPDTANGPQSSTLPFLGPAAQPGELGTLGGYRIQAELGRGGMGLVFQAYDPTLRRTVAVKVLRPELAATAARQRLVREAQLAAQFRHDHLVRVYAVCDPPDGLPYLVMEYLAGPALAKHIHSQGRLDVREAANLVAQVADGLEAAHQAGLVHRDVKPSNILLDTATGRAKLMDFGLARDTDLAHAPTQESQFAGTPAYMSPEQARGQPLDRRTDVYSLGMTLYEALTGELPFRGAPHLALDQLLHEEPRPPRRLNDAVPRDLETVCLKALAKEPGRRYPSAGEFAADLRRWLRGEPIHARPAGPVERLGRWCRRNRRVSTLAAALVLVFLGGVSGVLWQWSAAVDLRRRAESDRDEAQRQRFRAERNFAQAREAVDAYLTHISEHPGLKAHDFEPLRRELLQTARDFYERFVQQEPDDPDLQAELGLAHLRLGRITGILDTCPRAQEHYEKAQDIFKRLCQEAPDNPSFRKGLAESWLQLATIYRTTSRAELAEEALQHSRTLWDELVRAYPEEPDHHYNLAWTLKELGSLLLFNFNHYDKAEQAFSEARSHYERLLRRQPNEISYQFGYGLVLLHLAKVHGMMDQEQLQCADGQAAVAVLEPLAQTHPENPEHAFWLADTLNELGDGYLKQGQTDRAEAAWRKALAVDEELARRHPANGYYQHAVSEVTYNLATLLYHERHRPDEARRALKKAADIEKNFIKPIPPWASTGSILGISSGICTTSSGKPPGCKPPWTA